MVICVAIGDGGQVDPRWGRAHRVAVVRVEGGALTGWEEVEVGWDTLHDEGSEGAHHARVARFLRDRGVEAVVAQHMGPGMARMLGSMGISVRLGAGGDARLAVLAPPR